MSNVRNRAFSLIEVLLASSMLIVVLGVMTLMVEKNAEAAKFDLASGAAGHGGRKILQQISRELVEAGGDEFGNEWLTSHAYGLTTAAPVPPAAPFSTLTFRTRTSSDVVAAADAADNWSTVITYSVQASPGEIPNNALDDDNDGLVDEQTLVRTQDGATVVLDQGVLRFQVSRDGVNNPDQVRLLIEVGRGHDVRPGATTRFVSRVFETTLLVRNRAQTP